MRKQSEGNAGRPHLCLSLSASSPPNTESPQPTFLFPLAYFRLFVELYPSDVLSGGDAKSNILFMSDKYILLDF